MKVMVFRKKIAMKEEFYIQHRETFCSKKKQTYYISSCLSLIHCDPLKYLKVLNWRKWNW